jgi:hypothetical protein
LPVLAVQNLEGRIVTVGVVCTAVAVTIIANAVIACLTLPGSGRRCWACLAVVWARLEGLVAGAEAISTFPEDAAESFGRVSALAESGDHRSDVGDLLGPA